ncbi:formate dehydrogenase subunit delta [Kaistia defluvii]|uniref:formate dehydrogenase subunit delta n=1 Tax=Kaistia defluvii TaxID=410841 RepID=UPI00225878B6|nr:formate dehydrogenase subunit delta [Kaistia defluvii]MCX5521048.1 formate dehydrogenase subunit delta [Kaistia defluvii]
MSERSSEKLVHMANQIGTFFASQGAEQAPAAIADHLRKFWDPRMRAGILAHLEAGGADLDPLVRQAVERLRTMTAAR